MPDVYRLPLRVWGEAPDAPRIVVPGLHGRLLEEVVAVMPIYTPMGAPAWPADGRSTGCPGSDQAKLLVASQANKGGLYCLHARWTPSAASRR